MSASGPRSRISAFAILFFRGHRVFFHTRRRVQRNRAAIDFGSVGSVAVQHDCGVVLNIADQNGRADLYLGVGQRILNLKLQTAVLVFHGRRLASRGRRTASRGRSFASSGRRIAPRGGRIVYLKGRHNRFGADIDRSIRCHRTACCCRRFCSRNGNILRNSNLGVVLVGKDAYAGAEAKSRGFRFSAATATSTASAPAAIGSFHSVLNLLDRARRILGLRILGIGSIYRGIPHHLGGIDGLLSAILLARRRVIVLSLLGIV